MRCRLSFLPVVLLFAPCLRAQAIPSPEAHFGFAVGTDRKLADWSQLTSYFETLASTSARTTVDTLGATTGGRPFIMLTHTSPENHERLGELQRVQLSLSDPRKISGPAELEQLLDVGRTVVLITHGIHATEVGGPQMAARLAYRMAASTDEEILEILDNVIVLQIPSLNPDGTDWVVRWYGEWVGTEYEAAPLPWLYHFYVGHDNNRDWYALTQLETQMTVGAAHNAWHPQIVHDIHQMGQSGARIFFPPYIDPFERNVDPGLISALNQLGAYMAAELAAKGKKGVVINAQYDGFSPARAYQHYHGGVRILSETASVRIATPVTVAWEELRGRRGFDAQTASWNFPDPWPGGQWRLGDVVDYMEAGALALLENAARNRRFWLENFYAVNKRAVEKWPTWPHAWVLPTNQRNRTGLDAVLRILTLGDVEVRLARAPFTAAGRTFDAGTFVIPMTQPYASYAQALLQQQVYPDLREYPGGPPVAPYDVTAHNVPLLMAVEALPVTSPLTVPLSDPIPERVVTYRLPPGFQASNGPRVALYKSWREPMESGWTRWMFDQHGLQYDTLHDADVRQGGLASRYDVLVFQNQSEESILEGWPEGTIPRPYSGGLGEQGARAVRDFVRNGGRLIAMEEATDFASSLFELSIANAVDRLPNTDFYVPGSILRLEVEDGHPFGRWSSRETVAWYGPASRAFEVGDPTYVVVARYGEGNPLLSGWVLGPEHLSGRPAIVEVRVGRGSVVLFGFQPNYRAQTIASWPLLFGAMLEDEGPQRGQ